MAEENSNNRAGNQIGEAKYGVLISEAQKLNQKDSLNSVL